MLTERADLCYNNLIIRNYDKMLRRKKKNRFDGVRKINDYERHGRWFYEIIRRIQRFYLRFEKSVR